MIYKNINFLNFETLPKQQIKNALSFAQAFSSQEALRQTAIIDAELELETKHIKMFKATLVQFERAPQGASIAYPEKTYVITNANDQILFVYPKRKVSPKQTSLSISSKQFLSFGEYQSGDLTGLELADIDIVEQFIVARNCLRAEMQK